MQYSRRAKNKKTLPLFLYLFYANHGAFLDETEAESLEIRNFIRRASQQGCTVGTIFLCNLY